MNEFYSVSERPKVAIPSSKPCSVIKECSNIERGMNAPIPQLQRNEQIANILYYDKNERFLLRNNEGELLHAISITMN